MLRLSGIGVMGAVLLLAPAGMQAQDAKLSKVLAQMDAASARFQTASADFAWDQLTAAVNEHDVQKGNIAFKRTGKETAMVAHVLTEDDRPAPKDVLFRNGQLELYTPATKDEQIFQTGKNRATFESFATLGFGGSGKDLAAQWSVSYVGPETIDGKALEHLSLVPKAAGPNPMFTKVEIWVDAATATSVKQVFFTPGGDTRTAVYSNIKLNSTPDKAFRLDVPSGTTVVRK